MLIYMLCLTAMGANNFFLLVGYKTPNCKVFTRPMVKLATGEGGANGKFGDVQTTKLSLLKNLTTGGGGGCVQILYFSPKIDYSLLLVGYKIKISA